MILLILRYRVLDIGLPDCQFTLDLSQLRLNRAYLEGTKLIACDLRATSFRGADLSYANFSECRLEGADFRCANLYGANLSHSDVRGADFTGANLKMVIFDDVMYDDTTKWGSFIPPPLHSE